MPAIDYILARLKEPTTWGGIAAFLSGVGITIAPELWQEISAAGAAIGGLLMVLLKERAS